MNLEYFITQNKRATLTVALKISNTTYSAFAFSVVQQKYRPIKLLCQACSSKFKQNYTSRSHDPRGNVNTDAPALWVGLNEMKSDTRFSLGFALLNPIYKSFKDVPSRVF